MSDGNIPKNHHFVAQGHAEAFTNGEGGLWVFNKKRGKLFDTKPKSVFAETHLYTIESAEGEKDASFEAELAVLEGGAKPILNKLIAGARQGVAPVLSDEEKSIWDRYFYIQWKRVPDVHNRSPMLRDGDASIDAIFEKVSQAHPAAAAEIAKFDTPEQRRRLMQGAKVQALRKDPGQVMAILKARGLALLHIAAPGESLALGSLPIVLKAGGLRPEDAEAWLPIASDVAVTPAGPAGSIRIDVAEPGVAMRLNRIIAAQSSTFAAASRDLVETLVTELGAGGASVFTTE